MSHKRTKAEVTIAPWEHPVVWEFVGKGRYLQAAFCTSAKQLYAGKFGCFTWKCLTNIAAEGALIELVAWSKEIGCRWDESVFRSGARGGNVPLLKWLHDNDCPLPRDASLCSIAGAEGHLEALQFLRKSCGCVWNESFCDLAVVGGRLQILQYAHTQHLEGSNPDNPGWDSHKVCTIAARKGHIHILEWAHKTLHEDNLFVAKTCEAAACFGRLDVLQYLRSIGCEWDARTCLAAIGRGHVDVLKWALDNGCPWAVNDRGYHGRTGLHHTRSAAVIEFLISRGAELDAVDNDGRTPVHLAVLYGKLEAVVNFVRLGADVNRANLYGVTPLDVAIMDGYHEMVDVLRAAGARVSVPQ